MSVTIEELVNRGRLERVPADPALGDGFMNESKRHLASAKSIAKSDPDGAYALLYDAARKAVTGHMLANGYRAKNMQGSHQAVCLYAEEALEQSDHRDSVYELDRMRRTRHRSEYWAAALSQAELSTDLQHAANILAAVRSDG